jgi:hypothetical protein
MKILNEFFIPVAVDINLLMYQRDSEGQFFRHIAEQGHFAGKTKPAPTRQGLYVTGVDGDLLHSLNATDAKQILSLMGRGLAKWDQKQNGNARIAPLYESNKTDPKFAIDFPKDGLILRQTMRDLPSSSNPRRDTSRHNFDHVWFTAKEKSDFTPKKMEVGETWEVATQTVKRLVAFHTVDQVHGEADAWGSKDVKEASIQCRVVDIAKSKVLIELSGNAKCIKPPSGEMNPYNNRKIEKDITNDLRISGELLFDSESREFQSFRLLAAGMRSGAATYNFRFNDMGPSPIGFAFELLEDKPENRIKPKFLTWQYFWDE